ncbi:MAG: MAPEG family protein [Pseudomonadota bacterium]
MITGLYASLIGLLFLALSVRVITYRRANSISIGAGGDRLLERRIRAQGNLVEYAPITLILLWMLEAGGAAAWSIHCGGACLVLGRTMHGLALSSARPKPVLRVGGMFATLTVLGAASIALLVRALWFGGV